MRRLVLLIGLAVVGGCITPSIPIPPPDPARMLFEVDGIGGPVSTAVFSYPANVNYQGALVFVFNRDRGIGVIQQANDDGSVSPTAPLAAAIDEQVVVTFQRDDQTVSTCIRLRNGNQDPTNYC
ncbi:MAG: hypothetical protein WKG01_38275 [Kofleriaceae bacterium]